MILIYCQSMRFGVFVFFLSLFSSSLLATSFRIQSEETELQKAELICAVEMQEMNSESGIGRVKILDCAKGSPKTSEIEVKWPGSSTSKTRTFIPGIVRLEKGESGILYLTQDKKSERYFLESWKIQRLQPAEQNSDFILESSENSIHRRQNQREQKKFETWLDFKRRVQEKLR